jgi:anti-anti-sigma factor
MDELEPDGRALLDFDVSRSNRESVLVKLSGDLDLSTVGAVEAAVDPLLSQPTELLVVDAAGLRFADSSAIALWVRWSNLVDRVEIRQPPEMLRDLIQRMGLEERLRLRP